MENVKSIKTVRSIKDLRYTDSTGKTYILPIFLTNESTSELEDFIINVFIPNEVTYYPMRNYIPNETEANNSFIQYEAIEQLTDAEWIIIRVMRIIESEGIIIEGKPSLLENIEPQISITAPTRFYLKSKILTSETIQAKIREYKSLKQKIIEEESKLTKDSENNEQIIKQIKDNKEKISKIQEEVILSYVKFIKKRIELYSKIPTDKDLIEDICYETIIRSMDLYNEKTSSFDSYVMEAITRGVKRYYLKDSQIACLYRTYILNSINHMLIEYCVTLEELFNDEKLLNLLEDRVKKYAISSPRYSKNALEKNLKWFYVESLDVIDVYDNSPFEDEMLQEAIQKKVLNPDELEVLTRVIFNGESQIQLSKELGCTTYYISSTLDKAYKKLIKKGNFYEEENTL